LANDDACNQERTETTLRRRWIPLAAAAAAAWLGGFLLERWAWPPPPTQAPDFDAVREVAGLPVPSIAADLTPEYRALLEESRQAACRVVYDYPDDVQAVSALAMVHNLAHDDAGETACWYRCLELDHNCLMAYSALATRAANNREYQEAEGLLRRALQAPGASTAFALLLASVLSDQGKFREAAKALEDSLATQPATAQVHIAIGESYLQLNDLKKAKEHFQQAIRIDGSSSRAYHGLAQASARLGEKPEAEKYHAEVARLKRLETEAGRKQMQERGDRRGDPTLAPAYAAQVLTLTADVYRSHQRNDLAEQYLRRAAAIQPTDAACRVALAAWYSSEGRLADALGIVEELRLIEPRNLTHLKNLGVLQGRLGHWDAAQKTFRELCALAPDRAVGYAGLAEAYLRAGQEIPLAKLLAAKAARLEPSAWNFFILATICEQQGDLNAARSALQKAATLEPGNPRYQTPGASLQGKD